MWSTLAKFVIKVNDILPFSFSFIFFWGHQLLIVIVCIILSHSSVTAHIRYNIILMHTSCRRTHDCVDTCIYHKSHAVSSYF